MIITPVDHDSAAPLAFSCFVASPVVAKAVHLLLLSTASRNILPYQIVTVQQDKKHDEISRAA